MEAIADRFVEGREACGHRVPDSLRALAVRYARWASEVSELSLDSVAARLTICRATLERWLEQAPDDATPALREVVVTDGPAELPRATGAVVLVTPEGYRVEGLRLEELLAVLEALR